MKSSVSIWLSTLIKIWILNVKSMMVVNVLVVLTIVHVLYPQLNIWPGISDDNDSFSLALHELEAKARLNGFSIHNVTYDSNCMFSALSYQLKSTGVSNSELHQIVTNHLQSNPASYCNFVSQPVV